jgi:hypothetical protein
MKAQHLWLALALGASWRAAGAPEFVPFVIPTASSNASLIARAWRPIGDRYDRVLARDGHFFVDGQRLRIWGVNTCYAANFPTREEACRISSRQAAAGINAVRFHHLDSESYPQGIWDPADPSKLSAEALDRLDYFLDQLARHGIYANLNLHVMRSHARAIKLPDADALPECDKMVGLFTPSLIEAQKRYARELLTHVNHYRGTRYADDPAVAFVEISNEDSLFMWGADAALRKLPPFYAGILQRAFVDWLSERYGSTDKLRLAWAAGSEPPGKDLLANGDFSQFDRRKAVPVGWGLDLHNGCALRLLPVPGTKGAVRVQVDKADDVSWHLQVWQDKLPIKAGKYYTLSFRARADEPRPVWSSVIQAHDPWRNLGWWREEQLTPEWREFRYGFAAGSGDDDSRLSFCVSAATSSVELADVRFFPGGPEGLRKSETLDAGNIALFADPETAVRRWDRLEFLARTEKAFHDGMRTFIKNDLGVKALVTGTIVFGPLSLYAQSDMDYVDGHAYWQHPRFPGRPWDMNNWTIEQQAMVDHSDESPLFRLAAQRLQGKPYTVSEYNHPAPNDYQAETVPMVAAFAAAQDWDGVWLFSYSHQAGDAGRDRINGFFDVDANPAKWGFVRAGAAMFREQLMGSLVDARIVPLSKAAGRLGDLAALQERYGHDLFRAVSEPEKMGWETLLKTRLTVSLTGARLIAGGATAPEEGIETRMRWTVGQAFSAQGPGAWVWVGHAGKAGGTSAVSLQSPSFAALTLTALDGLPLAQSSRILLTACGRCENAGMKFSADRRTVGRNWGSAPVGIQAVDAEVKLPPVTPGRWLCRVLGPDGQPTAEGEFDPEKPFELSSGNRTMWYLLIRQ